jgi:soluble lytic murein transglycosylase
MRYVPGPAARAIVYWNAVAAVTLVALGAAAWVNRRHAIDEMIVQYSKPHGLDPRFVACVAWRESRFKADARSSADAIGVMQISKEVGMDWARAHKVRSHMQDDLYDPDTNIRVGTWNLARLNKRWSEKQDPLPYVLASYVAGPVHAARWDKAAGGDEDKFLENVTFPVARQYIEDILKRYRGRV